MKVLEPGVYWMSDPLGRVETQVYDVTVPEFDHRRLDVLLAEARDAIDGAFQVVELRDHEVGLVYKHDKLAGILPVGKRQLYWRGPVEVRVERVDVSTEIEVAADIAQLIGRAKGAPATAIAELVALVEVPDTSVGLLIVDGRYVRTVGPGLHGFWKVVRSVKVELVDGRVQTMEVSGQDILTQDKVSLRVNLTALWQVTDAVVARGALANFVEYLYKELQFALREAVGARTLDALLGAKGELDREIGQKVSARIAGLGLAVKSVGVKDLILPGDMKEILNQVVQAEKTAQANLIKRREETAATRSLLNTARLMDENPTLLRLKELETLEKVTEKIDKLTVYGGLEGVLKDVVRIKALES
ncbi:MAG TPA: slipin family protein [Steroidobacteraceae bacterium]|nr:slipin family protein [Steroidobacteraceae bacterium]